MPAPTLILLYLYKSFPAQIANREPFVPAPLDPDGGDYFANSARGDTYLTLARRWLEMGVFSRVKAIAIRYPPGHPRYSPAGVMPLGPGLDLYVLPNVWAYPEIHTPAPDDVLFVRGESAWEPILAHHPGAFRFYYNGSTRTAWRPRDSIAADAILLDDMAFAAQTDTPCLELLKCTDEALFCPLEGTRKEYDFCFIGRFDPRDKKGQLAFTRSTLYHRRRAIFIGEFADAQVVETVRRAWPHAEVVESVPKSEINAVLNRSRVSVVYSGSSDASPRIVTESLAAGTPVLLHRGNVARKYLLPGAGIATRRLTTEIDLWRLLHLPGWQPRAVYDAHFHSRIVAGRLWAGLEPLYRRKQGV